MDLTVTGGHLGAKRGPCARFMQADLGGDKQGCVLPYARRKIIGVLSGILSELETELAGDTFRQALQSGKELHLETLVEELLLEKREAVH